MSVIGWDDLVSDVGNIDLTLSTLEDTYDLHIGDVATGNSTPHVTAIDRVNWDAARTTANAAIPKVPEAVNNNLAVWSTGGVIKDSLLTIVTNFITPTDLTIPTTKAIDDAKQNKLTAGANITIVGNVISASGVPTDIIKYSAQTLEAGQKTQARANIGAGTSSFSGNYNDLSGKPTISTDISADAASDVNDSKP